MSIVAFHQKVYAHLAVLHASGRIDARTNFEDDVAHGEFSAVESADVDDGFQTDARVGVELFQSMESQDAVLVGHRHDVGGDAHGTEVEQRDKSGEWDAIVLGERLHELESHAAAAEVLEWEGVVGTFRVEYGHGWWHHVVGHVMVADDEVDAKAFGILNLLDCLDAAVEYDN